ncbi:hypothetical protein M9Y10_026181 [Tritrichomonas musculus]|uniref:Uncharacterized protein n=1 Tax=Tritrichomonas musculus TaxID=1915356 RepID=A0ABR2H7Y3_9EUKA
MFGFNYSQYSCEGCGNNYQYNISRQNRLRQDNFQPIQTDQEQKNSSNRKSNKSNQNQPKNDQKQNNYHHDFTPGEYSKKPFVNYYRNDLLPSSNDNNQENLYNNQKAPDYSRDSLALSDESSQQTTEKQKESIKNYSHNQSREHTNDQYQQTNTHSPFISTESNQNVATQLQTNPYKIKDNDKENYYQPENTNNQYQTNQNQTNEYIQHKYTPGEYSKKPFVNYYQNDLLVPSSNSNKQGNSNYNQQAPEYSPNIGSISNEYPQQQNSYQYQQNKNQFQQKENIRRQNINQYPNNQQYQESENQYNQYQQKTIVKANPNNQHEYIPGEYSKRPFVNYYRNDLLPPSSNNVGNENSNYNQQIPEHSPDSMAILDEPPQQQYLYHYQQNRNQYQQKTQVISSSNNNNYVTGEYSKKTFVKYYKNDSQTIKQENQANHQQNKPSYSNQNHSGIKYSPNSLAFPDEPQDGQNTQNGKTPPDDYTLSI